MNKGQIIALQLYRHKILKEKMLIFKQIGFYMFSKHKIELT